MVTVGSETFTSTGSPIQHAAVTAFRENEGIEKYLENYCGRMLKAVDRICDWTSQFK